MTPAPAPSRGAAMPFILLTVLIDMVAIGLMSAAQLSKIVCYDPANEWLLLIPTALLSMGMLMFYTLASSMIADVVEDAERCDDRGGAVAAKASSSMLGLGAVALNTSGISRAGRRCRVAAALDTGNREVGVRNARDGRYPSPQ